MRKITLGVLIDQRLFVGGGYQQALNAAVLAKQLSEDYCRTIFFTTVAENIDVLRKHGIEAEYLYLSKFWNLTRKMREHLTWPPAVKVARKVVGYNAFESFLIKNSIDLVYFTSPCALAATLERTNYIFTVWDLCHRDDPEFPEVREDRIFEARERLYNKTLTKAVAVIVDSETGKRNVVRRYGVDDARVHIIPFSPALGTTLTDQASTARYFDVKKTFDLEYDYVFYPAQFWAHKNHIYILRGLKVLEKKYNIRLGAIFAGGDVGGNLKYIKEMAKQLDLVDRVRFPGFIPNEQIPFLYKQAIALVMPTYFGPTNLPPLEAFALGVPVLYSDLPGLREQVGDCALLLNLSEPGDLAEKLFSLLSDPGVREKLVECGKARLKQFDDVDRLSVLKMIIYKFSIKRDCWK